MRLMEIYEAFDAPGAVNGQPYVAPAGGPSPWNVSVSLERPEFPLWSPHVTPDRPDRREIIFDAVKRTAEGRLAGYGLYWNERLGITSTGWWVAENEQDEADLARIASELQRQVDERRGHLAQMMDQPGMKSEQEDF